MKLIRGGESAVMAELFARTYVGPMSVRAVGVNVLWKLIFAEHGRILADKLADKIVWDVKRASGLKPCGFCANLVMSEDRFGPGLDHFDASGSLVTIACYDATKFVPFRDDDIYMLPTTI
jgi:hypothetical protein